MQIVPERNPRMLIVIGLGALASVFLAILFWRSANLKGKSASDIVFNDKQPQATLPVPQNPLEITSPSDVFQKTFEPVISPLAKPILHTSDSSSQEMPANSGVIEDGSNHNTGQVSSGPNAKPNNVPVPDNKRIWTQQELFDLTWKPEYRNYLIVIQDIMIKDGFMSPSEKNTALDSDAAIYAVLNNLFNYAFSKGWVPAEDIPKIKQGLAELPQRVDADRRALQGGATSSVVLPGSQKLVLSHLNTRSFFDDLINGFKYVLSIPDTYAQIPGVSGWHTTPDCYKDLNPLYAVPGFNLEAFCCNCGWFCTPYGCTFFPDCGGYSWRCNVPAGCLNLICLGWPNAIWDSPTNALGIGTCGCG